MPTPKTPLAKARLTGAAAKDPQRYRDRSEPKTSGEPIGDPPKSLIGASKDVWLELVSNLEWLQREDRTAVEVACVAVGQMRAITRAGEQVPASMLSAANTAIGKLGASPTDRQKVAVAPDETEDDAFSVFQH
jgi:phage terminase small subunit